MVGPVGGPQSSLLRRHCEELCDEAIQQLCAKAGLNAAAWGMVGPVGGPKSSLLRRHCEERSDEAIAMTRRSGSLEGLRLRRRDGLVGPVGSAEGSTCGGVGHGRASRRLEKLSSPPSLRGAERRSNPAAARKGTSRCKYAGLLRRHCEELRDEAIQQLCAKGIAPSQKRMTRREDALSPRPKLRQRAKGCLSRALSRQRRRLGLWRRRAR
jgi:hypothetical protein